LELTVYIDGDLWRKVSPKFDGQDINLNNQRNNIMSQETKAVISAVVAPGGFAYLTGTPGNKFLVKATNTDQVYSALVTVKNGKDNPLASEQTIEASTTRSWDVNELDATGKITVQNVSAEPVPGRPSITFTMTPA
jgi:hypothetical protein